MKGYRHLTLVDRCTIQEGREKGLSLSSIGKLLGVSKSSISREIKRNSNSYGDYNGLGADTYAQCRLTNALDCKRKLNGNLEEIVIQKLGERWSPEQISGRLRLEGKDYVCHETIYRWIYKNLDSDYLKETLRRFKTRRRRKNKRQNRYIKIMYRKSIGKRPKNVKLRKDIGHWERDLLEGQRGSGAVLAMVERKSRYSLLRKVKTKFSEKMNQTTAEVINENKKIKFKTMTNDNGPEFANPDKLEEKIKIPVYFTHPHCPWERGSVENLNGLLRQYLPKKTPFNDLNQKSLSAIQQALNFRPRKNLKYKTPHEVMFSTKIKLLRGQKYYRKHFIKREIESYLSFLRMTGF
jgi:transposase, IS30 family